MSLMLAPYNDSMRLGMGFNSYTQTLCIDKAVLVTETQVVRQDDPSQVATYSSKFVERLSDVVNSMNISHSTSIKKGTVEVAGNGNSINEEKIKSSDINAVVSVKVVNQTTIVPDNPQFNAMDGVYPGSQVFNDAFGDCYISGFIEGGDFTGIISMRVIDRSKTEQVTDSIKKSLSTGQSNDFALDIDAFTSGTSNVTALNDTETTISVSWMGGGQVKDPYTGWDLNSVYSAAAAFPSNVAKCPQRTWAILTKYKANRSFNEWSYRMAFSPLEYDQIASVTSELFDNYMEYKQLIKHVQDILTQSDAYEVQSTKSNAIDTDVDTLVAVRAAFRYEMGRIVEAVDILTKDPGILKRQATATFTSTNATVRQIIARALEGKDITPPAPVAAAPTWTGSGFPGSNGFPVSDSAVNINPTAASQDSSSSVVVVSPPTEDVAGKADVPTPSPADATTPSTAAAVTSTVQTADGAPSALPPATTPPVLGTTSSEFPTTHAPDTGPDPVLPPTAGLPRGADSSLPMPQTDSFNFDTLIAPEIWSDLLPLPRAVSAILPSTAASGSSDTAGNSFPPAPQTDVEEGKPTEPAKPEVKLEVLAAACGVLDCTETVRSWVKDSSTLTFRGSAVRDLAGGPDSLPTSTYQIFLAVVFQYTGGPMRMIVAKAEQITGAIDTSAIYDVSASSQNYVALDPTAWNVDTWSIVALVYGGTYYTSKDILGKVSDEIRTNYAGGKGKRGVSPSNALVGQDPAPGIVKSSLLFYRTSEQGRVRVAAGWEGGTPCIMSNSLIPADVHPPPPVVVPAVAPAPAPAPVPVPVPVPPAPPKVAMPLDPTPLCARVFYAKGQLTVKGGSNDPFLLFPNGIRFCFQTDGNFCIYNGPKFLWETKTANPAIKAADLVMYYQTDGNFVTYNKSTPLWAPNCMAADNQLLAFSSVSPYIEIGLLDSGAKWTARRVLAA